MTLGKKLYLSFGGVLLGVVFLFIVNWMAVRREHEAKKAAASSLELAEATDTIKFQMMQNRLYLSNYLLSGDTREVDRMNEGIHSLNDKLDKTHNLASSDQQKSALEKVQQLEQNWAKEFAQPLVDKRRDVDSGNATVAELQIFYLQKDASAWVKNSTEFLDVADKENKKIVEERRKSDESAAGWTRVFSWLSLLVAVLVIPTIAYRTAHSITEPLSKLMAVAHKIGNAGDLDHTVDVDIHRQDEIGELARTF